MSADHGQEPDLDKEDFRASRQYLPNEAFALSEGTWGHPTDLLPEETWQELLALPTDVLLRTSMSPVSSSWIVVIGTLGGVLVTAAAGIVTAYLSGHQRIAESKYQAAMEHDRQIRNERREIYVEYFSTYRAMYSRAHALAAEGGCVDQLQANTARGPLWVFENMATAEVLDFSRSFYALSICAGTETRQAADETTSTLWDLARASVMGDQVAVEEADSRTHESRRRLRAAMRADLSNL